MKYILLALIVSAACLTGGGGDRVPLSTLEPRSATDQCPAITVSCPFDPVGPGNLGIVSASVSGGDASFEPTYHWEISAGEIVSGQDTSTITVKPSFEGSTTLTVTVGGGNYPSECNKSASCTFSPYCRIVSRKFDTFGDLNTSKLDARLEDFAIELDNNPSAQGYVIVYGKVGGDPTKITSRIRRIEEYLIGNRGIDGGRIVSVDGGSLDQFTVELWIVPSVANPPTAGPKP